MSNITPNESTWSLTDSINVNFDNYHRLEGTRNYERENNAFIFPGPYAKNIAGPSAKVRRGFIRSILFGGDVAGVLNPNGKNPGNLRLNFQFNPEYIERRVQQSPGAVNPLLQAPANLTQAVPGTAQFNFTMMFNREAEVALREDNLNLFATKTVNGVPLPTVEITQESIDSAYGDPGQVGVMHDLAIFDKIIGQGISEELIDVLTSYTNRQIEEQNEAIQAANKAAQAADPDAIIKPTQDALPGDFKVTLNKNFGNSAFLNPMPVRIVFSDLFMVEGLVVGSAVAFQKFSQSMIPTICQVNCEVYALYVGFAQKNAFLTDNLTSWAKSTAQQAAQASANVIAETTKFKDSLVNGEVLINYGPNAGYAEGLLCPFFPNLSGDNNAYRRLTLHSSSQTPAYRLGNQFYSGASGTPSVNYVTVPQWYNTFADGGGNSSLTTLTNGDYAGSTIRKEYANIEYPGVKNQISSTHPYGFLPITIKVKTTYKDMQLNTKSDLVIVIRETKGGTTKKVSLPKADGTGWVLEKSEDYGNTGRVKIYTYRNTFYVSPNQVKSNKEFMQHDSSYAFVMNLKFNIIPPNQPNDVAQVNQTISLNFPTTNALFYHNEAGPNIPKPVQFKINRPGA